MKPAKLMWLGIITFAIGLITAIALDGAQATVLCFAGGCVFGKGYGIMEERERRAALASTEGEKR